METYKSKPSLYLLLWFVPVFTYVLQTYGWVYFFFVFIMSYFISSINFQFRIHEQHLMTEVFIWKWLIYKKTIKPEKISKIIFKRSGWTRKSAVIHICRGKNIRLVDYEPKTYCTKLEQFAHEHKIEVKKTKDFLLLERYYS